MAQFQKMKQQAEQKARELAQQTAAATARASWFTFFMLLIEAVLAASLENVGRKTQPRQILSHEPRH